MENLSDRKTSSHGVALIPVRTMCFKHCVWYGCSICKKKMIQTNCNFIRRISVFILRAFLSIGNHIDIRKWFQIVRFSSSFFLSLSLSLALCFFLFFSFTKHFFLLQHFICRHHKKFPLKLNARMRTVNGTKDWFFSSTSSYFSM